MEVNVNEYGYYIEPRYGKVLAAIYRVSKLKSIGDEPMHIDIANKTFGKWWRSNPVKEDYKNAKEWVDNQMSYIRKANENNN